MQDSLILGSRDFGGNGIPNTSKYGNKITPRGIENIITKISKRKL